MSTPDGGLAATLYGPCRAQATLPNGVRVTVACHTNYPFDESIRIEVTPERDAAFPLYFRVPGWCDNAAIEVNGRPTEVLINSNGFVKISRTWKASDEIALCLPMRRRLVYGRETSYPAIEYFRQPHSRKLAHVEGIHSPFVSVMYGPLLLALPIPDETPNHVASQTGWNYGLDVDSLDLTDPVEVIRSPMPNPWRWQLSAPLRLRVDAIKFDWQPTELNPLPDAPVAGSAKTRIELIPYGCTKFRISMFPVTDRLWLKLAEK